LHLSGAVLVSFLCLMAPRAVKIPVVRPCWIKRGYYFKKCTQYRTTSGIRYDYRLYNKFGRELKTQTRGKRQYESFNFSCGRWGERRLPIHRVFAFNFAACNTKPHRWSERTEVHHCPYPKAAPWTNCLAQNMKVLPRALHLAWHRR